MFTEPSLHLFGRLHQRYLQAVSRAVVIAVLAIVVSACSEDGSEDGSGDASDNEGLSVIAAQSSGNNNLTGNDLQLIAEQWGTNGANLSNQRYSSLDEINHDNIADVQAEWQVHLNSGLGPNHSGQGEPVVYEGVLYIVTGENDVFAIDLDNGEILWKYTANLDPKNVTVCCGWAQRGVSLGEGRVYVGTLDAHLLALDMQTGELLWDTLVEDSSAGYSITSAPRYFEGRVITGLAGGEYQVRGSVQSFDAATGEHQWTFYTVPGPGEIGHETWPDYNDAWMYGGAPIWQTPAIDPELGMMYFSTGNASPDQNGAIREGDNLFTVSIVALDVNTGEYRWHFQQTRHDIWDYDSSSPVVLFDVEQNGVQRKGISQISKSGYLFLLDRITGEPLTPILDVPVPQIAEQFTAATQPIPQGDSIISHCAESAPEGWELVNNACTYTPFGREPVLYSPLAGSNWMPTSYDPVAGYLYMCASESLGGAVLMDFSEDELGVQTGNMIYGGAFRLPQGTTRTSYQVAVDVRDHSVVWRFVSDAGCNSGSTVTAGGLLLTGRQDGRLLAYNSADGELLWEFQTDAGIHPSPVVFEHKGKQKILVFAAGTVFGSGPKGDSLWLLSLDGTMGPTEPDLSRVSGPPSINNPSEIAMPDSAPDLARGGEIYTSVCNACHGTDGQGGHAEGGAIPLDSTLEHIFNTANAGGEKMPPFASAFTPDELKSTAAYVLGTVLPKAQ